MSKHTNSTYKKLKQTYVDLWTNGKRNVNALKRIYIVNCILYLLELKKQYLRYAHNYSNNIFSRRITKIVNAKVLPRVEQVLRQIPTRYMDMNRKTRIYKYIMRKNQQLFQAKDQIISDLVFILERKRRKPFWRKTRFEKLFRLKNKLQQFYNISYKKLKNIAKTYRLTLETNLKLEDAYTKKKQKRQALSLYHKLETRLDTLLYRANFVPNITFGRNLITAGAVTVNGQCMRSCNYMANLFDVIEFTCPKQFEFALMQQKVESLSIFLTEYSKTTIFKKEIQQTILNKLINTILNIQNIQSKQQTTFLVVKEEFNLIEYLVIYSRFKLFLRKSQKHLWIQNNSIYIAYFPQIPKYPFKYSITDFQKVTNSLLS
jgi:ribosomal protein S4